MLSGFDVSEFQGIIDYGQFKPDFMIIRDVYSTTHIDTQFARNLAQARANNIARACYSFAEPAFTSPLDAVQYTIAAHDSYLRGEGQWLDVERDIGPSLVSWVREWVQRFTQARSFIPGVYLNRDLLAKYDWSPVQQLNSGLWLATGSGDPGNVAYDLHGWTVLAMQQYILDGPSVSGVNANIDRDAFYGDRAAFELYGSRGDIIIGPTPPPPPPPPPPPVIGHPYTVVAGDTLSGIAGRCGIGWRDLWQFDGNPQAIPNPDLIYPGQVIQTPCDTGPSPHTDPTDCGYKVQEGDTLSSIAAAHGISWIDLWHYGGNDSEIPNPNLIYPGQVIQVPC